MIAFTSALITASLFGLLFPTTRWFSVVCIAILVYLYPLVSLLLILLAAVAVYFIRFR